MNLFQQLRAGHPFDSRIWWIDEEGNEHLNEPLSPSNEDRFLRHLGQAKLELLPNLVEITWDTGLVHEASMVALAELFTRLNLDVTIRLSFYYHGWVHEIHKSSFWAAERIEKIQECKSVALLHETLIKTCSLSDVQFASSRIRQGFESWEKSKGLFEKLDQSEYAKILSNVLILRTDKREENIVYSWVGTQSTAAKINGLDWVEESIGEVAHRAFGCETQSFAEKVNVGIARTIISGEPLYQHIRTLVRLEDQEPFWMPYERLLTRHVLRDGGFAVICDVYPTQYVNISLAGNP